MKKNLFSSVALKVAALVGIAIFTAGCASGPGTPGAGGTAALPDNPNAVQGRDLGRGGGTSGPLSSVDPGGNAADWSVYDARHPQQ